MRQVCFTSFWLVLLTLFLNSCTKDEVNLVGNIYGKITSTFDGEPLSGVSVTITPGGRSTLTGSDGSFNFVDCEPGQYNIQAQKTGFKTNYKQVSILSGQTSVVDISLEPTVESTNMVVYPTELVFDNNIDVLVIKVKNNGNSGSVSWNVSGISEEWLYVSPIVGITGAGGESAISVHIDRTVLSSVESSVFIVNFSGGSQAIRLTVK